MTSLLLGSTRNFGLGLCQWLLWGLEPAHVHLSHRALQSKRLK